MGEMGKQSAFPVVRDQNLCESSDDYGSIFSSEGLTKRELFAAMAMQGFLAVAASGKDLLKGREHMRIEEAAVYMADALLAELEKPNG